MYVRSLTLYMTECAICSYIQLAIKKYNFLSQQYDVHHFTILKQLEYYYNKTIT